MNEMFRYLAAQAYKETHPGKDPDNEADAVWAGFDALEKRFAELIVKECAKLATEEFDKGGTIHGVDLLTHFGLKGAINDYTSTVGRE